MNAYHTTDIAGSGNPQLKDIRRVAESCGIKGWRDMLEEVRSATRQWGRIAGEVGIASSEESRRIGKTLAEIGQHLR
ncbi:hypothetical protein [Thiothrix nivea]|uniref:hypothetical protein n=1 Tax=Thiothrix nivea TaxID=1031 RepID=UPI00031C13C6|nr:hypothetical protein [Thiothrix nivea]